MSNEMGVLKPVEPGKCSWLVASDGPGRGRFCLAPAPKDRLFCPEHEEFAVRHLEAGVAGGSGRDLQVVSGTRRDVVLRVH